jgi:lysophospholipase L1-like esterase
MPPFVWFLAGGRAFFLGIVLLLCAMCVSVLKRSILRNLTIYVMALVGIFLVVASATPLPRAFYVVSAVVLLAWLVCVACASEERRLAERGLTCVTAGLCVAAMVIEAPHQRLPRVSEQFKTLCVIGDSVSAGMGSASELTWPRILRAQGIDVTDLSRAGATVGSALRQQANDIPENALVVLEIGGNDLLGIAATQHTDFERDLRGLLQRASDTGRTVVLLELPLLPWHVEYGRIQRRLAREFGVILVPKRFLAGIFAAEGATSDGIHLTPKGQELMAENMKAVLYTSTHKVR